MKILHIAPHLGGGVGKAHAAVATALPATIEQTFALLEQARDRRFIEPIEARGRTVVAACDLDRAARLARDADIVQFEFWNHPRLFECLARADFPAMRTVFWSHVSGIVRPVIQPGLIEQAGRFVFTTEASYGIRSIAMLPEAARRTMTAINSGFGFAVPPPRPPRADTPLVAYLGTVDFVKMHPGFFDAVDRLDGNVRVCVWGRFDPDGAVAARARAMRHPERIDLRGHTADPAQALAAADIFFYPLQPDHYGTSENALVEAMSLGLPAVVLGNPAERAIVRHEQTGLIAGSIDECVALLQRLLRSPELRERIGRNAARHVAENRTPAQSARQFLDLWQELSREPARRANFRRVIGDSPAEWFLATQCLPGETWQPSAREGEFAPSKGKLAHFQSAFPSDPSLSRLVPPAP